MSSENFPEYSKSDRLLATLQRLLELSANQATETMHQAALLVAHGVNADKVDLLLFHPESESLTAFGISPTPLGEKETTIGLDWFPLSEGGRVVEVYLSGQSYWTGQAQRDPQELTGMKEQLAIKSEIIVPFSINTQRRGVLFASSQTPDFFTEPDVRFLEAVAHWVGVVVQRAELNELYLREATEKAQRLAAEEILTVLAHDLGNYLAPIKGRLDLLERRARREKQETYERELGAVTQGMKRLQSLIADLLDAERLKRGLFAFHRQPVNLAEVLEEVVPIWSLPAHPIYLQIVDALTILADRDRMQQVIENLLSNAVTHADPQTPIQVRLQREERRDGPWAVLTVSNQGTAMSPEQLQALFQPFVRGVRSPGLGLGLWLSQRLAHAHQGTLIARMEAEHTIGLTLSLPLQTQQLLPQEG
jgi:two-component system OmpR family sensor kinase